MARNKEVLVFLLDVSPSMHNVLPQIEKLCFMLVQKKLLYGKTDEVGVILFGTEDTNNELTDEVGGYEHVMILRHVKVVDGDIADSLQMLPRGTRSGDFLDAIVVAMDVLIKKFGPTNKGKQRLCLITSAHCPIKQPFEGTKEDQIDAISLQMKAHGMKMDCIIVRGNLVGPANQRVIDENDRLLNLFSKRSITKTTYIENSTSLLGSLRTRNVNPVTIFRGDLEISPLMKVKVWVYKKTYEEKFPTLKRFSDKAPPSDKFATHEVQIDFEYKREDKTDTIIPPEQRIKGYRYGPQVVPISSAEWDAVKFKPEKGVKLLGFTDASNIMRHYYMKDVCVFIPEPGNKKAVSAVSSIVRAMKELNKVAIVRCVWRQGQGNVIVGVLTPNISLVDNIADSFYFNVLPFAEDVREFQFTSFNNLPSSCQPNERQQEAADNLVRMLDLAPPGVQEALQPDFTPNPVLERFYHFLELRSKQPDASVPPIDFNLKKITEPELQLSFGNQFLVDNFQDHFELKENPQIKKSTRRIWRQNTVTPNQELEHSDKNVSSIQNTNLIKNAKDLKVSDIGDLNPIQDFEAMMTRRDGGEWVGKAIRGMKNFIYDLLENSYEGDNYQNAVDCLLALRKGCVIEQEPKEFNRFVHFLCEKCKEFGLDDFLKLLTSTHLTLISKKEAIDSDLSEDEARDFLLKLEPTPET